MRSLRYDEAFLFKTLYVETDFKFDSRLDR